MSGRSSLSRISLTRPVHQTPSVGPAMPISTESPSFLVWVNPFFEFLEVQYRSTNFFQATDPGSVQLRITMSDLSWRFRFD